MGDPAAALTEPADATNPSWSEPEPAVTPPPAPAFTPPPVPPPPAPPSGRGLLIAAAVVGGTGVILRVATSISVVRAMHIDGGLPLATMGRGAFFYSPLIATGLGLAGAGMARRGRLDAHHELFDGTPPKRARHKKLGWGLFGAGLGVWAVTRIAGVTACRGSNDCQAKVWEWGYYLSLAGTVPGVIMGGYASGYDGYHRRYRHLADVSLAPVAHRHGGGLSLSGRF